MTEYLDERERVLQQELEEISALRLLVDQLEGFRGEFCYYRSNLFGDRVMRASVFSSYYGYDITLAFDGQWMIQDDDYGEPVDSGSGLESLIPALRHIRAYL